MDSSQLNSLLNRLCKILWSAQVTNPITYVTQISYLIFLKMLEEMEAETALLGKGDQKTLFAKFKIGGEEIDYKPLRWSLLTSDPDNDRMLRTLRDTLPLLAQHPRLSQGAKAIFDRASVVIPDGATLKLCVDIITPISFLVEDADVKGDLFEMLASNLGGQKLSAQFRTPRHLIRVIVEMVDPRIGETICDSACGSGGFLIASYDHIILRNTSSEMIYDRETPYGSKVNKGVGDGFEGDQDIIRMAAMNAVLHGFDQSPIVRRDSIGGGEDVWDEMQFDCILENPPFSGAAQSPKRSLRIEKGEKYVLFLAAALRSLRPGGRAGIVLPNGILFGDTGSHLEVKKRLLAEFDLQAVVALPKGMFEPYTPNNTCFLVFQKTGKPTKKTWFYNVQGDGSSLRKARKFGPQFQNDFPDLLKKWPKRLTADGVAWRVPAEKLIANGYNLSLASLGLVESEKVDHAEPDEILSSVAEKEQRILGIIEEMQELLSDHKNGTR
jgi:type I restriction enzyme M protein